MAGLGSGVFTLGDMSKLLNPDGSTAKMAFLLSQKNGIAQDLFLQEGNLPTGHQVVVETQLPGVAYRQTNAGIVPTTGLSAQMTEGVSMLEAYSQVDARLVKMARDPGMFRAQRANRYFESMNQTQTATIIYGNANSNPDQFTGLAPRYSTLSASVATSVNIINGGGVTTATKTSIWCVDHGDGKIYGTFGQGSDGGLQHEDLGLETVTMTAGQPGSLMRAYRDHFVWEMGLVVEDWRCAARLCNIDVPLTEAGGTFTGGNVDLIQGMEKLIEKMPDPESPNIRFYLNRKMNTMLNVQARLAVQSGGQLSYDVVDGKRLKFFQGKQIRIVDQIINTEPVVA